MSKYSIDTTIAVTSETTQVICKICNRILLCKKGEDPLTRKCGNCGHTFGKKVQSYVDDVPNASSETHDRYSWFCNECSCRGLKWVEKALDLVICPNCNAPLSPHMVRVIDPIKGRLKTIWEPIQTVPVKSSTNRFKPASAMFKPSTTSKPLKYGTCVSCGHQYSFRIMTPFRCFSCGAKAGKFISEVDAAAATAVVAAAREIVKDLHLE